MLSWAAAAAAGGGGAANPPGDVIDVESPKENELDRDLRELLLSLVLDRNSPVKAARVLKCLWRRLLAGAEENGLMRDVWEPPPISDSLEPLDVIWLPNAVMVLREEKLVGIRPR